MVAEGSSQFSNLCEQDLQQNKDSDIDDNVFFQPFQICSFESRSGIVLDLVFTCSNYSIS